MDPTQVLVQVAFDATTGYLTAKTLDPVFDKVWHVVKRAMFPRWDQAEEGIRLRLREHIDKRLAEDKDFLAKLVRSLKADEGSALLSQMVREAAQASTEDRLHLLAAAAAGLMTPDLDSESRSRVARAVASLEVSDAQRLVEVDRSGGQQTIDDPKLDGLLLAGCIESNQGRLGYPPFRMTNLGKSVLQVLRDWTKEHPGTR